MGALESKRVTVVADSHGETAPGRRLRERLRAAGATAVDVQAVSGRSAVGYVRHELAAYAALLARDRPEVVVVLLGTNDAPSANLRHAYGILRRYGQDAGADVWLVGPPGIPYDDALHARLGAVADIGREVFGPARFIDSQPLTGREAALRVKPHAAGAPWLHFNDAGGAQWAAGIVARLDDDAAEQLDTTQAPAPARTGAAPVLGLLLGVFVTGLVAAHRNRRR